MTLPRLGLISRTDAEWLLDTRPHFKSQLDLCLLSLFFFLYLFVPCQSLAQEAPPPAPSAVESPSSLPPVYQITGTVRSGKTPLPGVTVTAANTLTGKKFTAATAIDGTYTLSNLPRGRYVVRVEFMGFADQTHEVVLKPETPADKFDAELILASRQPQQPDAAAALMAAGRGFQSLAVDSTLSALSGGGGAPDFGGNPGGNPADLSSLPANGMGADGPTESVSISGAQGQSRDFGNGSEQDLQDRIQEFRQRAQDSGLIPGGGGGGAGGGLGGDGRQVIIMGRLPRGFNINQPHGTLYVSDDAAALDAKPFSLNGLDTPKASYNLARFGAFVGGPLNIPKIFNGGDKWFFFGGWNGSRGSTPFDAFSTVPTVAERSGDFSALTNKDGSPVTLVNPAGSQFVVGGQPCVQSNIVNSACLSSSAANLLQFIPQPNLGGSTNNFHFVTSDASSADTVSLRLIHNFNGGGAQGLMSGRGGGGRGGQRRAQNNLNLGLNWARNSTDVVNIFPSLAGHNNTQGLSANAGWSYGNGKATNNLRFNYNHNHVSSTNLFSNSVDVAGAAGIGGVSTNPFDFGIPGIDFTTFGSLTDPTPRRELDQTYTVSDTVVWSRGKHNWRFGADYRRILQSFRSAKNAEGNFIFTGFQTGSDFADFLLGLPQQTSLQSGTDSYNFRANSYDFFAQDDWRLRPSLSLNLGLRYEYNGPYTEAQDHIANLLVTPQFASATPVLAGQAALPPSLIRPDRNNFAPRLGLAWRAPKKIVVRAGYGINYNLAQYANIIQNFAFQPPFAITSTNLSAPGALLTLANGFPVTSPTSVTNNFAVDPNYRLGYVQVWNVDIQHQLRGGVLLNIDYNGSKGTRLDIERALPATTAFQSFIYESSAGNSVFHAGSIRVRKRLSHGIGITGNYTYSKSIDDASSIGGGAGIVAQNPFDIAADRSLSNFDQRHKFTGTWNYDLPFGENRRFAQKGSLSHVLDGWQWSGDFTIASGLPLTPRVVGSEVDLTRGVSGSLRANVTGAPIGLADPTTAEFFNTAAFCSPIVGSSTGTSNACATPGGTIFGDAGRNIIEGPGQITFDMNMSKTITIKESRALELRIQAANVFNTVHFSSINTTVNSFAFGEVTGVGTMRRVTMLARFRF